MAPLALAVALALPAPAPAQGLSGVAGPYLAAEDAARRGDIAEAARFYAEALAHDSANPDLLERTMTNQMAAGQVERAIPVARRLDALAPRHHLGILLLAADALRRDDAARARQILTGDDIASAPYVAQLMDAWAAFQAGDAAAARDRLEGLERDRTGGVAGEIIAAYHLGLLRAAEGDDAESAEALDRAAEKSGNGTLRLARIRAGVMARLGQVEDAQAIVAERLALTLGDKRLEALQRDLAAGKVPPPVIETGLQGAAESLFSVSGFLARNENKLMALAYSQLAIYLDPDLVEARLLVADILSQSRQFELAITAYEAVPDDAPEALDARIGHAEALYQLDRKAEAEAALRETVVRFPRSIEANSALGDVLRRTEQYAEAAEAYGKAIDALGAPEQRHWALYYQRGISYERAKMWDQAEADFLEALELRPDQPLVLNYLGYSWVEMGRNLDQAREMIEKAVEQEPKDGYIVDSLGWVLYRIGDYPGAVEHLERAVELKPVDPVINDHFGDALWMVGRRTEARFQWKRALSFKPEEKDAERIRKKLRDGLDTVLADEAAAAAGTGKNGG